MSKAVDDKYLYSDLSYEIIGAAQEAQNRIGAGAREEKRIKKRSSWPCADLEKLAKKR